MPEVIFEYPTEEVPLEELTLTNAERSALRLYKQLRKAFEAGKGLHVTFDSRAQSLRVPSEVQYFALKDGFDCVRGRLLRDPLPDGAPKDQCRRQLYLEKKVD